VKSPVDAFRYLFSQQMLGQIVQETNRYAGAAQKLVHNLNATNEEILTFIGIMLLSGYHPLPYRTKTLLETRPRRSFAISF
jgi:hypothetical protein